MCSFFLARRHQFGRPPLWAAASKGHSAVVDWLLLNGAAIVLVDKVCGGSCAWLGIDSACADKPWV